MSVEIHILPFDPWQVLEHYTRTSEALKQGKFGATASFVGTMRDFNDGDSVECMTLEHYPGMTERQLEEICLSASTKWPLLDVLVVHRVGDLAPGDPIVLVATWSAHRGAAFDSCRFVMEELKSNAPFWKKEQNQAHGRWVKSNTPA